jgi:hypothetical protein
LRLEIFSEFRAGLSTELKYQQVRGYGPRAKVETPYGLRTCFEATVPREGNLPLVAGSPGCYSYATKTRPKIRRYGRLGRRSTGGEQPSILVLLRDGQADLRWLICCRRPRVGPESHRSATSSTP